MVSKRVCGALYAQALLNYPITNNRDHYLFMSGFVHGQCEKVYLGVCNAVMILPAKNDFKISLEIVKDAAKLYKLLPPRLLHTNIGTEIWVLRNKSSEILWNHFIVCGEDSEIWHTLRGKLCGVPDNEIDIKFHCQTSV